MSGESKTMAASSSGDRHRSKCCFVEWMEKQERDLAELEEAQGSSTAGVDDARLIGLAEKAVSHFEEYMRQRSKLSRADPAAFFAPTWCTPWENSLLWIAGCRPSSYFRLIYGLGAAYAETGLQAFLSGTAPDFGELSASQLSLVDEVHRRTVRAEDRLSSRFSRLQEEVADRPIAAIVKDCERWRVGEVSGEVDGALDAHEQKMAAALEEADELRLCTVKEVLAILTPPQAVDFLAVGKKLHLCIHKWSKLRDQRHRH